VTRPQPTQPTYADLEIRILDRQAAGYPVELTVAGRQLPRGFLDPDALPLPWTAGADPATDGERLLRWLLADPAVKEAWDRANGLDGYCRVRLRIDAAAPELHTVSWELLRRPAGPGVAAHDLAASDKTPFSRFLALPSPPGSQIIDERLRVLVAVADPDDLARFQLTPIDRATEIAALEAAVAGLPVELTELTGPCTLPAIERALRRGYHVLHFVGHGVYMESAGAALFLADDANQVQIARADQVAAMLARLAGPDNALQLVFLGSCQTAVASPADAFRGLAPQLLQAGIPAVLAMQDLVPVPTYRAFAQAFYRQLMQHGAVDLAANQARAALLTARLPGAAIPVLFSRVPDGKLLAIPGVDANAPAPGQPPYKGLQHFDVGDAADFHGREHLTAELVDFLRHNSLLAVVGASGSGKSSLVRAGLVHAVQSGQALADGVTAPEGSQNWLVHIITPTARPLESLAASLTRDSESVRAAAVLTDDLAQDPRSLDFYARRLLSQPGAGERLLLVVDQFEELFTLCKDKAQRKAFVDNLLAAACPEAGGGCNPDDTSTLVVLTLRADFYAQCLDIENLRAPLERYQRIIGAMSQEELRRAIEQPARRGGWELEPGLVDMLLRDVGDEPGALPLLSHALLETWKRRRGRTLTLAGYAASGRVQGAIARTADEVYTRRLTPDQQEIARRIFLELTELGEGSQDTRRRVTLRDLIPQNEDAPAVERVLQVLAGARLVTTFQDEAQVSHDALIREWPALRKWLDANREGLRTGRRLAEAAREWQREGEDPDSLYRGARLAQALEWTAGRPDSLNPTAQRFLEASRAAAEEAEREREAARQRELEAAHQRELEQAQMLAKVEDALAEAKRQARRAQAGELSAYAQTSAAKNTLDPSESLLLADLALRATWGDDGYVTANAADAAIAAIEAAPPWRLTLPPRRHTDSVSSAAYSPDGARIVTASRDQTARVWDAESGEELLSLRGHTSWVLSAAYSPDGARIVTASADQTARVWDAASGEELLSLRGHTDLVRSAAYSPDGARIVTASADQTVRVWDALSGQELLSLRGRTDWVLSAAYSPDGARIVTASAHQTVWVWDALSLEELLTLRGHTASVNSAAYSPDGARIVTASGDGTARVWDAASGQELLSLRGHTSKVVSAAYSPDGVRIVTAGYDKTARVWDARSGEELFSLRGHTGSVWSAAYGSSGASSAAYSPDGARIVTAGDDQTARVWDASSGLEMLSPRGHTDRVYSAAYSPNGARIVTASADQTARVWDAASGEELLSLRGHTDLVSSAAYSPDGARIVTASADQTVRVWDALSGQELLSLRGHTAGVSLAAYSPDGARIVTASADQTVRVWDALSGQELLSLRSHTDRFYSPAYSPDGARIVTASTDQTARVWDAASGEELLSLRGHARMGVAAA
jgi:WD40 repeat protein